MKKIYSMLLLPLLALLVVACDPSEIGNSTPAQGVTADAVSQSFTITQEQVDGKATNRITFSTGGKYYVHVKDQAGTILASGREGKATLPFFGKNQTEVTVEAINPDASVVSFKKDINVEKWVDVPDFLDLIFGDDLTRKVTTTWTWDADTYGGTVFCNGSWMQLNSLTEGWWKVSKTDIDGQCTDKNLPQDNFANGWMKFSYDPAGGYTVTTSRGESGKLTFGVDKAQDGWDVGTMTFNGTMPLFGIMVNFDNQRQYKYQILKNGSDGTHLVLAAPEPNVTDAGGTAWYWAFKRTKIEYGE